MVSGNFVWAKNWGSPVLNEGGNSIFIANSNIYIIGGFGGTVDFDPGPGIYNLTPIGSVIFSFQS